METMNQHTQEGRNGHIAFVLKVVSNRCGYAPIVFGAAAMWPGIGRERL